MSSFQPFTLRIINEHDTDYSLTVEIDETTTVQQLRSIIEKQYKGNPSSSKQTLFYHDQILDSNDELHTIFTSKDGNNDSSLIMNIKLKLHEGSDTVEKMGLVSAKSVSTNKPGKSSYMRLNSNDNDEEEEITSNPSMIASLVHTYAICNGFMSMRITQN